MSAVGPPGNKKALKHGYYSLVTLVKSRGGAWISAPS